MPNNVEDNLVWQWILLIAVPPIGLILRNAFSEAILQCCGKGYSLLFYWAVTIVVVADVIALLIKTWDKIKPIVESIVEIISEIIRFLKR